MLQLCSLVLNFRTVILKLHNINVLILNNNNMHIIGNKLQQQQQQ